MTQTPPVRTAADIPAEITKLIYTLPASAQSPRSFAPALSQNQIADLLAHFWPAIEAHIRQQVAEEGAR